jgi:predicted tellurium resistance membrane protein TerC
MPSDRILVAMVNLAPVAEFIIASSAKSRVAAPLIAVCVLIAVAIPIAAARSRFHMPGYIGMAIVAFIASLLFGEISGAERINGSMAGVVLSIGCFLSIAVCVGAILALVVYRDPPEPQETKE